MLDEGVFLVTTTSIPINLYVSIFVSFHFISHVSIFISPGRVSSDDNKRDPSHLSRLHRENVWISPIFQESEWSERVSEPVWVDRASLWMKRGSKASVVERGDAKWVSGSNNERERA